MVAMAVEVSFVEVAVCFFLVVDRAVLVVAPNVTGEETDVAAGTVPVEVKDGLLDDDNTSDAGDDDTDGLG